MIGVNNQIRNLQVKLYIAWNFPSSTALYWLSNDIEGHKKKLIFVRIWFH